MDVDSEEEEVQPKQKAKKEDKHGCIASVAKIRT